MIGKTLGHYEITSQLGKGGMGEVYQAKDLKLGRDVAIKVLPEEFARDVDRVARFQREAKLLASLNHPSIAAIYGLEESGGTQFLVLELVGGETLADQIKKGPLPVEESLKLALQIAEALEAAHEKGVIHRDLKPANIKVTPDGKVKVLDFGLAKAFAGEQEDLNLSNSPTLSVAATRQGIILGTAAYMSPEQARGKRVDKRTDIWAFGAILYEMLTGQQLFMGETVSDTLASVLTKEPDMAKIPEKARPLLKQCLARDPKDRLRDIGDARAWIESAPVAAPEFRPAKHPWLAWLWGTIATILLIVFAVPYFSGRKAPDAMSFNMPAPNMPIDYSFAVSPDGRSIAFTASNSTGGSSLFVCDIGSITPRQLNGTDGANLPFWSPDSRSIGFFAGGRLKRVEAAGGFPRDICTVPGSSYGGTWNKNGVIVYGDDPLLYRVASSGGQAAPITALDASQKEYTHQYPCFLPDGRSFFYNIIFSQPSKNGIYVGSLDSKKKSRFLDADSMAILAGPDTFLFQRNGTLLAQQFDPKKLALIGEAVHIADNIEVPLNGWAAFGASNNDVLVYRTGQTSSQFIWFDRTGKQIEPAGDPGKYHPYFDLSPDGKQIAMDWTNPETSNWEIWLMDWVRKVPTRFTTDPSATGFPRWSPDGRRIAFISYRKGRGDLYVKNSSGAAAETVLLDSPADKQMWAWSKDGQYIAYSENSGDSNWNWDIYALPLLGQNKPFPIVQSPGFQSQADFSFDDKWLAYSSYETGTCQVYVVSFPKADRKLQISNSGGVQPRWRRDGKELYYLSSDGKLMAVDMAYRSGIEAGIPRVLFDAKVSAFDYGDQYEVNADGQRFLVLKPLAETESTPFTVVTHWKSLLKK